MKNHLKLFLIILLSGFIFQNFAQSDYEIAQSFKSKQQEIQSQIKNATTLEELNSVVTMIDQLKEEYAGKKDLLDKSLYPENYDKTILKLNNSYLLRQGDFTTIDVLQTEVTALVQQVEFLNKRNNELISQINDLETKGKKDKKTIAKLENLVAELRSSLQKRDRLVIEMVDSLMPPLMREKPTLTLEDKQQVASEVEKENVLTNVKRTINDNIKFLEVTSLQPKDLSDIRKQQDEFSKTWRYIGVKLIDVYSENEQKSKEIKRIDSLFTGWYKAVDDEAWETINEEFALNEIQLVSFNSGSEFVNVVLSFINGEIKNIGVKSEVESQTTYHNFTDSTWFGVIEKTWLPYLLENELLSASQKDEIDSKISEWKGELYPSKWWIYLILALALVAIIVFVMIRRKPKQESNTPLKL